MFLYLMLEVNFVEGPVKTVKMMILMVLMTTKNCE